MNNLLLKEKLVVLFCWGAGFFFLGTGWYEFLTSQSSLSNLAISTGVAITIFSTGFTPKVFYMPIRSALKDIQSPILVNIETQQYITLSGIVISSIGLATQFLF